MLDHVRLQAMKIQAHKTVRGGLLVLGRGLAVGLLCASTAAQASAAAQTEPSASAYRVHAVCAPPAPGSASCLALRLVAKEPLAVPGARALRDSAGATPRSASPAVVEQTTPIPRSLTPNALHAAYDLPTTTAASATQTIGIVDAYDDANVEGDLRRYDQQFDLPECTSEDGCFSKVNQAAKATPLPPSLGVTERGWAQEIATDVEMAHSVCQNCHIVLAEANSEEYADLEQAEQAAVALGATEISNSWGGAEPNFDNQAFNHPGIVITASSGDDGWRNWFAEPEARFVNYPAASPHVVAVGGTRLLLNQADNAWLGEEVWNDGAEEEGFKEEAGFGAGGSGCSEDLPAPAWQLSLSNWAAVGCGEKRAVADVSADGDPLTGVAVYDSTENEGTKGWNIIGGTSVASPIIAAVFALAGGAHGVAYPARTLYENEARSSSSLHDVVSGSNGECLKPFDFQSEQSSCSAHEEAESCLQEAICLAGPGYDGPTGLGTPDGLAAFEPPAEAQREASTIERRIETQPVASPASPPSQIATPLVRPAIRLSGLTLTLSALIALNHSHPRISQVGFTFDANVAAPVRVALARRVRSHRHMRWQTLPGSLTLAAIAGRNSHRLSGHQVLPAGAYRLTLTPGGGAARSLDFQIG
jgi:hypothetical protein